MQDKFTNYDALRYQTSLEDVMSEHVSNRKVRKFFKFAVPVLVLEILVIIAISIYLIIVPKNFCNISTNVKNAVIYINEEKSKRFKFTQPNEKLGNWEKWAEKQSLLGQIDARPCVFLVHVIEEFAVLLVQDSSRNALVKMCPWKVG